MTDEKRLYLILFPTHALIASQFDPEKFAQHLQVGSRRHYGGKLIFAEIDPEFRNEYFDIDNAFSQMPKPDGSLKATKFLRTYRVLEHIDFDKVKKLYISNPGGIVLGLDQAPYDKTHQSGFLRVFAQICPITMLALANFVPMDYAQYLTDPGYAKGAPKVLFTQLELNIDKFLKDFENNPLMQSPLPFLHPSKLRDAINSVRNAHGTKPVKGLALHSDISKVSFAQLRTGFWMASQEKILYFPLPSVDEIKKNHFSFYRSM